MAYSRALTIATASMLALSWAMCAGAQWFPRYGRQNAGSYRHYPHRFHPRPGRQWRKAAQPVQHSRHAFPPESMPHTAAKSNGDIMRNRKHVVPDERGATKQVPGILSSRKLYGGRRGETMVEQDDGTLVIRIPGYRGERFDVQLTGKQTITLRSLSRYRGRGYGYIRRFQLPSNAIPNGITADHLRGSGLEIRIPTFETAKSQVFATEAQVKETIVKDNGPHRITLADRLNRGWEDPDGFLIDEDYSEEDTGDGPEVQVIDLGSSIHEAYVKDADAMAGYIDVRGSWQSY